MSPCSRKISLLLIMDIEFNKIVLMSGQVFLISYTYTVDSKVLAKPRKTGA